MYLNRFRSDCRNISLTNLLAVSLFALRAYEFEILLTAESGWNPLEIWRSLIVSESDPDSSGRVMYVIFLLITKRLRLIQPPFEYS